MVSKWHPNVEKYELLSLFGISKWCLSGKKYELLPLLGFRSGAPVKRKKYWRYLRVRSGAPSAQKYDRLSLIENIERCPSAKKYDFCRYL